MAALAALCKPHSASEQKLSMPVHSILLDDFEYSLYLARRVTSCLDLFLPRVGVREANLFNISF